MNNDIWKQAVEAGIAPQKKRGAIPVVDAGKLVGLFHPRPLVSFILWFAGTGVLLTNHESGYWVLGVFMVLFTLARGAIGVFAGTSTEAGNKVYGRIYAYLMFIIGFTCLGIGGFSILAVIAYFDGYFNFVMSGRSRNLRKSKHNYSTGSQLDDPLFIEGLDTEFGGYGARDH